MKSRPPYCDACDRIAGKCACPKPCATCGASEKGLEPDMGTEPGPEPDLNKALGELVDAAGGDSETGYLRGSDLVKSQVNVKASVRHSKSGAVVQVRQHTMAVDKHALIAAMAHHMGGHENVPDHAGLHAAIDRALDQHHEAQRIKHVRYEGGAWRTSNTKPAAEPGAAQLHVGGGKVKLSVGGELKHHVPITHDAAPGGGAASPTGGDAAPPAPEAIAYQRTIDDRINFMRLQEKGGNFKNLSPASKDNFLDWAEGVYAKTGDQTFKISLDHMKNAKGVRRPSVKDHEAYARKNGTITVTVPGRDENDPGTRHEIEVDEHKRPVTPAPGSQAAQDGVDKATHEKNKAEAKRIRDRKNADRLKGLSNDDLKGELRDHEAEQARRYDPKGTITANGPSDDHDAARQEAIDRGWKRGDDGKLGPVAPATPTPPSRDDAPAPGSRVNEQTVYRVSKLRKASETIAMLGDQDIHAHMASADHLAEMAAKYPHTHPTDTRDIAFRVLSAGKTELQRRLGQRDPLAFDGAQADGAPNKLIKVESPTAGVYHVTVGNKPLHKREGGMSKEQAMAAIAEHAAPDNYQAVVDNRGVINMGGTSDAHISAHADKVVADAASYPLPVLEAMFNSHIIDARSAPHPAQRKAAMRIMARLTPMIDAAKKAAETPDGWTAHGGGGGGIAKDIGYGKIRIQETPDGKHMGWTEDRNGYSIDKPQTFATRAEAIAAMTPASAEPAPSGMSDEELTGRLATLHHEAQVSNLPNHKAIAHEALQAEAVARGFKRRVQGDGRLGHLQPPKVRVEDVGPAKGTDSTRPAGTAPDAQAPAPSAADQQKQLRAKRDLQGWANDRLGSHSNMYMMSRRVVTQPYLENGATVLQRASGKPVHIAIADGKYSLVVAGEVLVSSKRGADIRNAILHEGAKYTGDGQPGAKADILPHDISPKVHANKDGSFTYHSHGTHTTGNRATTFASAEAAHEHLKTIMGAKEHAKAIAKVQADADAAKAIGLTDYQAHDPQDADKIAMANRTGLTPLELARARLILRKNDSLDAAIAHVKETQPPGNVDLVTDHIKRVHADNQAQASAGDAGMAKGMTAGIVAAAQRQAETTGEAIAIFKSMAGDLTVAPEQSDDARRLRLGGAELVARCRRGARPPVIT